MSSLEPVAFTSPSGRIRLSVAPFHDSQHAEMVSELGTAIEALDAMRRQIVAMTLEAGPVSFGPDGFTVNT